MSNLQFQQIDPIIRMQLVQSKKEGSSHAACENLKIYYFFLLALFAAVDQNPGHKRSCHKISNL